MTLLRKQVFDFVAVAEAGSLSAAARRLYMTQSSLSQEMSQFERELGFKLFSRSTSGSAPTSAGQALYVDCKRLVSSHDETLERARQADMRQEVVRIGIVSLSDGLTYQRAIRAFNRRRPNAHVSFVLSEYAQRNREKGLMEGRFDLMRCEWHDSIPGSGARFTDLCMDENCLLMARSHPLAAREAVSLRDLDGERLVILDNGSDSMAEVVKASVLFLCPTVDVVVANLDEALFSRICMGECMLLATMSMVTGAYSDIVGVRLEGTDPARMGLIHLEKPPDAVAEFIACVIESGPQAPGGTDAARPVTANWEESRTASRTADWTVNCTAG